MSLKMNKSFIFGLVGIIIIVVGISVGVWYATIGEDEPLSTEKPILKSDVKHFIRTHQGLILLYDTDRGTYNKILSDRIFGLVSFDYYLDKTVYYSTTQTSSPIKSLSEDYQNISLASEWIKSAMAVDYVAKNLYVVDNMENQVNIVGLDNIYRNTLLNKLRGPKDIALDPEEGLMFVLDEIAIHQASMDGTKSQILVDIPNLTAMTIDKNNKIIYYSDSSYIKSYDYVKRGVGPLSIHILDVFDLSYSNNRFLLLIGSKPQQEKLLVECSLDPVKCKDTCCGVNVFYKTPALAEVKAYETTPPAVKNPCKEDNGGCPHLCVLTSDKQLNKTCICNKGWVWNEVEKTCKTRSVDNIKI